METMGATVGTVRGDIGLQVQRWGDSEGAAMGDSGEMVGVGLAPSSGSPLLPRFPHGESSCLLLL